MSLHSLAVCKTPAASSSNSTIPWCNFAKRPTVVPFSLALLIVTACYIFIMNINYHKEQANICNSVTKTQQGKLATKGRLTWASPKQMRLMTADTDETTSGGLSPINECCRKGITWWARWWKTPAASRNNVADCTRSMTVRRNQLVNFTPLVLKVKKKKYKS